MKRKIEQKCGPQRHGLAAVYFRCPLEDGSAEIWWTQKEIKTDRDVEQMLNTNMHHRTLGPVELYADFRRTSDEVIALLRQDPDLASADNNDAFDLSED